MTQDVPALYGSVLVGGRSQRMGQDKSLLMYHGEPQVNRCLKLLGKVCEEVVVSCREEQQIETEQPRVIDQYPDSGPLGAVLSLFDFEPGCAWLVLACDLPVVDVKLLEMLVSYRDPHRLATAFQTGHSAFAEPLCTIYEPAAVSDIRRAYDSGQYRLVDVLRDMNPAVMELPNGEELQNVNTPDNYQRYMESRS